MNNKITIAQIGLGKWGINLLRNFGALSDCFVKYGCDLDSKQFDKFRKEYPSTIFIDDYSKILEDAEVEAVVIATPAPEHYEVAKRSLEKGKHIFVEKPITLEIEHAEELVVLAKKANKKIMVGHLLLYHPVIRELKRLIDSDELGKIYYIYTQRLNLGRIRNTENAMWSLAPHDISVLLYLFGIFPSSVSALGSSFVQKGIEDLAFLNVRFPDGEIGHIHVSWLDPTKTRKTIIAGNKKMAIFDELAGSKSLTLLDKGVDINQKNRLRIGKEENIKIGDGQPLALECRHFIDCINSGSEPLSNGENGLAVLKILSAADRSLKNGGKNEILCS